jgi:hypothetical protein
MIDHKIHTALYFLLAASLTACGGGGSGGDADQNVVRTLFAVGDVVEMVEDGGSVEGDVSTNDRGGVFTFALAPGADMANGVLEFNQDGSFIYTPNPDFFGTDSVGYVATDPASGETDTATLTISVENDFEQIEEYGWQLVWADDFNSGEFDSALWSGVNATVAGGNLVVAAQEGQVSTAVGSSSFRYGRVEAIVRAPAGEDVFATFKLAPVNDLHDGLNVLAAIETDNGAVIAGTHYGLGLTSGISMNLEVVETVASDFHNYAIEWGEDEIRWYIDGVHVHTVNTLHTWAYNMSGSDVVTDNDGPFNQDMQVVFELSTGADNLPASIIVDQVKVWSCDPSVELSVEDCASGEKTKVSKQASDRIETVGPVVTEIYANGYYDKVTGAKISDLPPLEWHHTDEIKELTISNDSAADVDSLSTDGERGNVLEITNDSGSASIGIATEAVELIGLDVTLSFDMYIDSAKTSVENIEISMQSGVDGKGVYLAELTLDEWASYSVPVVELVNNPAVVEGVEMPLDLKAVTSLMTLDIEGSALIHLDNIQLSCINSEGCVQGPLGLQSEAAPKAKPIRYEAEAYIGASGAGLEATLDEGGGQNIAFVGAGDFLVYSIDAPGIGPYSIDYRVASAGGSAGFEVSIDGVVVDQQEIPDTGDWQNWTTITSAQFDLVVGLYTLRIDFLGDGQNLNWFELLPPITEIFIQAEDFDDESGIALEETTDEGGGENIGYIDEGDFVEYSIIVPSAGTYLIEYRMASDMDSLGFDNTIGGVVLDTQTLLRTGGWQEWITQSAEVELVAGEQIMRFDFLGGPVNINWIRLTRK